jgi:hypothetical protein
MADTITIPDEDDETPPTPEELLVELGQLHTRALASPLPQHPAAMGWQMIAASLASGFARALHALGERDPQAAVELATLYHGPLGDGPDPGEHTDWLIGHVAKSVDVFDQWVDEARSAAAGAKAATVALATKEASDG